jgi:HNH endonuclease
VPQLTNPRAYERAHELVATGRWTVDAEAGAVYSTRFQRPISPSVSKKGYRSLPVWLPELKKRLNVLLHRLVWETVHGPIPPGLQINHKNGDKADNRVANLELTTAGENTRHAMDTGLRRPLRGVELPHARFSEDEVRDIRARLTAGALQREVAAVYGTTQQHISAIARRAVWAHVA